MDDMYQPAALFIGLRYMRGRAADRFGRFVSWLSTIGITLGVMALSLISDDVFFDMAFAPQRGFHHLFLGQMLINQIGF